MATIEQLTKDNNNIYPVTKAEAVYDEDDTTVQSRIDSAVYATDPEPIEPETPWVTNSMLDKDTFTFGNYSFTEQDTGFTWVDGKHIYKFTKEFTYNGSVPQSLSVKVITGTLVDVKVLVDADGWWAVATTSADSESRGIATWVYRKTTGSIDFYQNVQLLAGAKLYVTILYTK